MKNILCLRKARKFANSLIEVTALINHDGRASHVASWPSKRLSSSAKRIREARRLIA